MTAKGKGAAAAVGVIGRAAKSALRTSKTDLAARRAAREAKFRARVAGTTHKKTKVPFDADGNPQFPSTYDHRMPAGTNTPSTSDTTQFREATRGLQREIEARPGLAKQFTPEQLAAISRGEARIPGLTWHHHQDGVTLQLVDRGTHNSTFHYGGRHATGGRS